ncbi:MAG: (2Fe-2S)-binding protein [Beijerinckiaceae bacterium]
MNAALSLVVNGRPCTPQSDPELMLLDLLRGELGLMATRFGCGEGLCGACNVLADGRAVTACNTPVWSVTGKAITTLEGLGNRDNPHPLQQAFIDEQAMQCGYCISGIMISAAALLAVRPEPTDGEIRSALDANLCRCGAHNRIVRAVRRAAAAMRTGARRG